jgi:adenylate cyclase
MLSAVFGGTTGVLEGFVLTPVPQLQITLQIAATAVARTNAAVPWKTPICADGLFLIMGKRDKPTVKSHWGDIPIAMSPGLKRAFYVVAIAATASLAVLLASRFPSFQDINNLVYDFTIDHAGLSAPSPQILFVDFDEDSFAHIRQYPIPRPLIADTIQRIGAGKPRVLGVDIFLSEPRTPAEDQQMQDALTSAGVVILASQASTGNLPAVRPLPQFCQPEDPAADSGFCIEGKPGALGYALVDMPINPDGFVREFNLFSAGSPPSISFPLFLAQQYAGETIKPQDRNSASFLSHPVPYHDRELATALIGVWGVDPATHISAWQLLQGKIPPQTFAGKLVLLGQSNDAARDTWLTPLFRTADANGVRERMGGTEILAGAMRSLLEGKTVRAATVWVQWIFIAIAALAATYFLLFFELRQGILRLLALMLVCAIVPMLLYACWRYWLPFFPTELSLLLTLPLALGLQFAEERLISREAAAQREQLMSLFSSYVDPSVAETIWKRRDELSLGGEEHIATVMFTDIRGFTALSANQPPAQVLCWLNRYLTAMDEVIREHGGFLNKFIGDGLMIIFGLPLSAGSPQLDATRALQAALAMLARVQQLNEEKADPTMPSLRIGIGIHSGTLMAGSIGSATRQEYSVIGETVNLASRLESLNKSFKTEILLSAATREIVGPDFSGIESLGLAKVAGLDEPVAVFTLHPLDSVDVALSQPQVAVS